MKRKQIKCEITVIFYHGSFAKSVITNLAKETNINLRFYKPVEQYLQKNCTLFYTLICKQ